jgi:hypothetical protein
MGRISVVALVLAALLGTGCHKLFSLRMHAHPLATKSDSTNPGLLPRDLGILTLTNDFDTCVSLGLGKDCVLTPKLVDRHNVQLTVAVESKDANGKIHDMYMTQIVTPVGQPSEVAVGNFNFSLTPTMAPE